MVCSNAGLIGEEMFAIDGCKLPSNASKDWSGTHADLTKKQHKIDRAVRRMLKRHKDEDIKQINEPEIRQKDEAQIKKLKAISKKIKKHLTTTDEKLGCRGTPIKSNITDNDSAKMKTSHGVIQGYVGVSAVDNKTQIIISAEAFGQCQEHDLLEPIVNTVKENLQIPAFTTNTMLLFVRKKILMLISRIKAFDQETLVLKITNALNQKPKPKPKSILYLLISLLIKSAIAVIALRVKRCGSAPPTQQWASMSIIVLKVT